MADPVYSYRHHERAANLKPFDIVSVRNGGFIEAWEVDVKADFGLVLVTPRGDNHCTLAFNEDERVDFLRPHVIPER